METVLTNILNLLKEKGRTQKDLCDYLHIGKQALTNWKSGNNKSYMSKLKDISNFLDCSILDLYGVSDVLPKDTLEDNLQFNQEETELVKSYRLLKDDKKKELRSLILSMLLED